MPRMARLVPPFTDKVCAVRLNFVTFGMKKESPRPRGRPLAFDVDAALDAAVGVFWAKGYDAASLEDLTRAMAINRPSLYAKFGNKHNLFMAAIDRYAATISQPQTNPLATEENVETAVRGYFSEIVKCVASPNHPAGCLIASVATELAVRDPEVRQKVTALLSGAENFIETRLQQVQYGTDGRGPTAKVAAAMIVAVGQSLASRARLGATPDELEAVADGFADQVFHADPESRLSGEF